MKDMHKQIDNLCNVSNAKSDKNANLKKKLQKPNSLNFVPILLHEDIFIFGFKFHDTSVKWVPI